MRHEDPKKVIRNIKEALQTSAFIAEDAKRDHKDHEDAFQYYRGKEEAFKHALEIVVLFERDL